MIHTAKRVAEEDLGQIDWKSPDRGHCTCPGAALHSSRTAKRDCTIFLDGPPTVYCFHSSCDSAVANANFRIRSAIGKERSTNKAYTPTLAEQLTRAERGRKEREKEKLIAKAKASLPMIVEEFSGSTADLWEASPVRLLDGPEADWRMQLNLFPPRSIVWIGDIRDSAGEDKSEWLKAKAREHFRRVEDWLDSDTAPLGPFICPCTFVRGSASRCKANVSSKPFLVIESDVLSHEEATAVIFFLKQKYRLRAVIDTCGKSLHAWFDHPPEEDIPQLKIILENLGCDPAMFSASQAVRLAGVPRYGTDNGTPYYMGCQSLLYVDL